MSGKTTTVVAGYRDRGQAELAVEALVEAGFTPGDTSVLGADGVSTRNFRYERHTKAPEGTVAGAAAGGVVGGTLGWLAATGVLVIPQLGALTAAGPIMAALAGLGGGGAVGGVIGALSGMGVPEYEARRHKSRVKSGGVLLSVHCDAPDEVDTARNVLKRTGGQDIAAADDPKPDAMDDMLRAAYRTHQL